MQSGNTIILQNATAVSALCATSIAVLLASAWFWKKSNWKDNPKPSKWAKVGTVSKLIIYPRKSCHGVDLEKAVLTQMGLKSQEANILDRLFMLVDESKKQVTMVKFPKMSLIKPEIGTELGSLTLPAPSMPSITFSIPKSDGKKEEVCRIRLDPHVKALDCGDEVAQWLQDYLGDTTLRLFFHHLNQTQRRLEPYMLKCPQFKQSDMGAFSNESAYMLMSQESVDELNKRLEKEVTFKNFRPNILISQVNEPFAEVNWSFVKIGNGNGILKACVPCKRCPLTTVDQDEGVLAKDGEPLKTLQKMNIADKVADNRMDEILKDKGIMGLRLGLYLPACEGAEINAGDPVYAALL